MEEGIIDLSLLLRSSGDVRTSEFSLWHLQKRRLMYWCSGYTRHFQQYRNYWKLILTSVRYETLAPWCHGTMPLIISCCCVSPAAPYHFHHCFFIHSFNPLCARKCCRMCCCSQAQTSLIFHPFKPYEVRPLWLQHAPKLGYCAKCGSSRGILDTSCTVNAICLSCYDALHIMPVCSIDEAAQASEPETLIALSQCHRRSKVRNTL